MLICITYENDKCSYGQVILVTGYIVLMPNFLYLAKILRLNNAISCQDERRLHS